VETCCDLNERSNRSGFSYYIPDFEKALISE